MNQEVQTIIQQNSSDLDLAKPHTQYKIKYIKTYVKSWLPVAINSSKNDINFIDCMCNAGVYRNELFCTCIEVLMQYKYYADKYPHKKFNLYLNDYNSKRISILKEVIKSLEIEEFKNIVVHYDNQDVVDYLKGFGKYKIDNWNSFNLLYVDPYNFGTNNLIDVVYNFLNTYYCELFYNFFSSDITRNTNNKSTKLKSAQIIKELTGVFEDFNADNFDAFDLMLKLQNKMKQSKNIKYSFSYQFKGAEKNVELYYIMFFTPNIKGLDFVKQVIWEVFQGEPSFSKGFYENIDKLTLFDTEKILIQAYSNKLQPDLLRLFNNQEISYEEIEKYVLENTLLRSGQIIENVLKPMIEKGNIIKKNIISKRNYKQDRYLFQIVV